MQYFRRTLILKLFKLSDICFFLVAAGLSYLHTSEARRTLDLDGFLRIKVELVNVIGLLFMILLWHSLFKYFQLYQSRRIGSHIKEIIDIIKAISIATFSMVLAGKVFQSDIIKFQFIAEFWLTSIILTALFRISLRYFLKIIRMHGRNLRFMLIVGTNQKAYDFAKMITEKKELGYRVVGYIDNIKYQNRKDINILGTLEEFPDILKNYVVDEVVICLPVKSFYDDIHEVIKRAEEQGIVIRYLSQLFDTSLARSRSGMLEGYTVMTMASGPQVGWQLMTKRLMDVLLSSVAILLTLPIMIFAAVMIKLDSPGPVLFVQDRIGYNKRIFRCFKFRTMGKGAEKKQAELEARNEMDGPVFKIQNDPRITRVGKWLRKTSIDELPQFFNVLRGEMSLVGPRPLPMRDFRNFGEAWLNRRCSVLPGLTCTWQIMGRNNITFDKWIQLDMQYIDNWNLYADLKILIKTIPVIIRGVGAA